MREGSERNWSICSGCWRRVRMPRVPPIVVVSVPAATNPETISMISSFVMRSLASWAWTRSETRSSRGSRRRSAASSRTYSQISTMEASDSRRSSGERKGLTPRTASRPSCRHRSSSLPFGGTPVMRPMTVLGMGSVNSAKRSTTPLRPRSGAANCSTTSRTWPSIRLTARGVRAADTSRRMRACCSGGAAKGLLAAIHCAIASSGGRWCSYCRRSFVVSGCVKSARTSS